MSWNYRIIKYKSINPNTKEKTIYYHIHEVYYDKKGNITAMSMNPMAAYGEDKISSLKADMNLMLKAFDKPALSKDKLDKQFGKDK